jgi:hypothetical protein
MPGLAIKRSSAPLASAALPDVDVRSLVIDL